MTASVLKLLVSVVAVLAPAGCAVLRARTDTDSNKLAEAKQGPKTLVGPSPASVLSANGEHSMSHKPPLIVQSGLTASLDLLYGTTICLGFAAAVVLLGVIYDAMGSWRHRAHFHKCQKKVEAVHDALLSTKGDMLLCPLCVEPVSGQPSPSEVVHLCGHRFHMKCANKWFSECPQHSGLCPMCEGPVAFKPRSKVEEDGESSLNWRDEAKSFILHRLHKQYPDIVTKNCAERWTSCHTELWLNELECPRYQSIFHKPK